MNRKIRLMGLAVTPIDLFFIVLAGVVLAILLALALTRPASAQGDPTKQAVTADDVNAVARKLYCPVCENIPLDTCETLACQQWRDEIRIQLEEGRTPQQVIDDFVVRFGDRVVGTPQDPLLRFLSLAVPWMVSIAALIGAVIVFQRWRREQTAALTGKTPAGAASAATHPQEAAEDYRARLERDLAARR